MIRNGQFYNEEQVTPPRHDKEWMELEKRFHEAKTSKDFSKVCKEMRAYQGYDY